MASLSNNIYGSQISKGVGGLVSGLDTDDLVKQMTAVTRGKINREYQAKQKLLYRQEAYREISTKLLSFNNKYFSYSSGSEANILSPKFFESYTFKSSSDYVNVTGNAENIGNFTINEIKSVATVASFNSSKKVSVEEFSSAEITEYISSLAGETFSLNYEDNVYNFAISKDFGKNLKDENGIQRKVTLEDVVTELNKQLAKMKDKDGNLVNADLDVNGNIINENKNLKYKISGGGIVFDIDDGRKAAGLTAASTKFAEVLKMEVGHIAASMDPVDAESLVRTAKDVMLKGSITFEFNGILKTIDLSQMEPKKPGDKTYAYTSEGLAEFLQDKLNKEYGEGKVAVDGTGGSLSFKANSNVDIFGVSSISKELGYFTGIESGDYNRLNRNKPLKESGIAGIESIAVEDLSNGEKGYKLRINDVDIEIEETMSVNDIISKINNNSEAGVKVYYSPTTNTFTVKASETGSHKGVSIAAGDGTLAAALFGKGMYIEDLIKDQLQTDEYFVYNEDDSTYIIYKKTGTEEDPDNDTVVGTAKLESDNKINFDFIEQSRNNVVQNSDYLIKKGTDTTITYTLNGVKTTITRSSANFTIDDINIELNEKAKGTKESVAFDVINNADEVVERVKEFINEYNEIINLIGTKTSEKPKRDYPPLTPEQRDDMKEDEIKNWTEEAKKGILYGDRKTNAILRNMRSAMTGFTDVSRFTLSSIGISSASMDTSGKLVFDEKKFKEKLLENPDEIANLFTQISDKEGTDAISGIAVQLQSILKENIGAYGNSGLLIEEAGLDGGMTADRNYISEKIEKHDDKMAELKKYLERERQRYWKQFSDLEQSLNKLNAQSSWLTDMMGGN